MSLAKPKIAILTLPLHTNFGGNIQAYALSQVLQEIGCDVKVLNLQRLYHSRFDNYLHYLKQILKKVVFQKQPIFRLPVSQHLIIRKNHTDFIEKNIPKTAPILNIKYLDKFFENNHFDAICVGSDQIWRASYSPRIESYFLDFVENNNNMKKISYAASFGVDYWEFNSKTTQRLKQLAHKFDYISVREKSAVKLCNENLGVDAEHVLDPTMLLNINKYLDLCMDIPNNHVGKIFTYILDENDSKRIFIENFSKNLNKESFSIKVSNFPKNVTKLDDPKKYTVSKIEEWISAFRDADFVITDSFHGMVFSILFNKQFLAIANNERGTTRFSSLLNYFNLNERLLTIDKLADYEKFVENRINYEKVNEKLKNDRLIIKRKLSKILNLDFT